MRPMSMIPAPLRSVVELVLTLAIAVGIALAAQAFVVKPYRVPTPSMVPTLERNDRVLADRISLRFREPERYEIVVFHPPACPAQLSSQGVCTTSDLDARTGASDQTFIKRVVGLPGETVFTKNGVVHVQSPGGGVLKLDEPYLEGQRTVIDGRITVPAGYYFMMGDNRGNSQDSRVWGVEPRDDILGIARARYWPIDRLGLL